MAYPEVSPADREAHLRGETMRSSFFAEAVSAPGCDTALRIADVNFSDAFNRLVDLPSGHELACTSGLPGSFLCVPLLQDRGVKRDEEEEV